jgi:hypothetical protein
LLVIRFSAASTTPSLARMPTQDPALEIASMAYLQAGRNTAGAATRRLGWTKAGSRHRSALPPWPTHCCSLFRGVVGTPWASHSLYLVQAALWAENCRVLQRHEGGTAGHQAHANHGQSRRLAKAISLPIDERVAQSLLNIPLCSPSHTAAP